MTLKETIENICENQIPKVVQYLKGFSEKELNSRSNFGMITSSVLNKAERAISEMPAADVQPVKHGRWIISDDKNWLTCPFCDADVDVSVGILMYVDNDEVSHINFCPNCGCKQDLEGSDING